MPRKAQWKLQYGVHTLSVWQMWQKVTDFCGKSRFWVDPFFDLANIFTFDQRFTIYYTQLESFHFRFPLVVTVKIRHV